MSVLKSTLNRKWGWKHAPFVALICVAVFIFVAPASDALAQSTTCSNLRSQLAAIGSKRILRPSNKFSRAIQTQRQQLSKVRGALSSLGCRSRRKLFARSIHPRCSPLRKHRRRMERNLASLKSKSRKGSANSSHIGRSDKLRRKLKRYLRLEGCNSGRVKKKTNRRERELAQKKLRAQERRVQARKYKSAKQSETAIEQVSLKGGTFKTMCVRTCDGYFFPVSFSTVQEEFGRDSQACNQLCPGVDIQLFYQDISDDNPENMISARAGKPYSKMRNAFYFKKAYNPSCRCNYQSFKRTVRISTANLKSVEKSRKKLRLFHSIPQSRPDYGQDPETLANRNSTAEIGDVLLEPRKRKAPSLRKIRIVGEAHFPDQ